MMSSYFAITLPDWLQFRSSLNPKQREQNMTSPECSEHKLNKDRDPTVKRMSKMDSFLMQCGTHTYEQLLVRSLSSVQYGAKLHNKNINDCVSTENNLLIGSAYIFFSIIDILLYVPCMIVLRSDDLRHKDAYNLMFHAGIFDLLQTFMHLVSGVLTITNGKTKIDAVFGPIIISSWLGYLAVTTVQAVNRLLHMAIPRIATKLFTMRLTKIYILLCYIYTFIWFVVFMTPYASFIYRRNMDMFYYNDTVETSGLVQLIELIVCGTQLGVIGFSYVGVLRAMNKMRREITADTTAAQNTKAQEMRIPLQLLLIFLLHCSFILLWMIIPEVYEHLNFETYRSAWSKFWILNLYWIIINGINPVVYLTLNKTIRQKIRNLLTGKWSWCSPASSSNPIILLVPIFQAIN